MRLKPLERDIEKAIQQAFLLNHGIVLWKIDAGQARMRFKAGETFRGYSDIPRGFPDLLGLIPANGRALFVEVKRPGCKPTQVQLDFISYLCSRGAVAYWADSVDSALRQYAAMVYACHRD